VGFEYLPKKLKGRDQQGPVTVYLS